jgi:hypothetical protein
MFNGGGSATAESGVGDVAIADGPNSNAISQGGVGDFASVFSTGSSDAKAIAGSQVIDAFGNNFDYASAFANNSDALAGYPSLLRICRAPPSSLHFGRDFGGGTNGPCAAIAGLNGIFDFANAIGGTGGASAGLSHDAVGHPLKRGRKGRLHQGQKSNP